MRTTENPAIRRNGNLFGAFLVKSLVFGLLWAGFLGWQVAGPLWQKGHRTAEEMFFIVLICSASSFLAVLGTRTICHWIVATRPASVRFAATFILLTILTTGLMALIFGLHFRVYFAQWHAPFPDFYWFIQFIFTVAYSVYLFISNTIHPLVSMTNVALLIAFSWWIKPQAPHQNLPLPGGNR